METITLGRIALMELIQPGDYVVTVFNDNFSYPVKRVRRSGAGWAITVATADGQSEQQLRGVEIRRLIRDQTCYTLDKQPPLYQPSSPPVEAKRTAQKEKAADNLKKPKPAAPPVTVTKDPAPTDFIRELLKRVDYRQVAADLGFDVPALEEKYQHLDAGRHRMCYGNLIRAHYKKSPEDFHRYNKENS